MLLPTTAESNGVPLEGGDEVPGRDRAGPSVVAAHVLVTTDGSDAANRALPVALAVVRACDSSHVTLMRVLTPTNAVSHGSSSPVHALEWALARAQVEAELSRLAGNFDELQDRVDPIVVEGRAAEQIVRFIDTSDVDLLVLASHGSNDARAWSMGSVARKLVVGSSASVLLVPAELEFKGFSRVLVPLDCSVRAESVLPLLPKLAEAHDPEFVLVHVVPRAELSHRLPADSRDLELVDELTQRNQQRAEAYLYAVRDRMQARGVRARAEVLVDSNPARTIERLLGDSRADLLLIGAHGAGSEAGEAYGSVARRLLESLQVPLWIVQDLPATGLKSGERH